MNTQTKITCREACREDLPEMLRLFTQPEIDDGKVLPLPEAERYFERIASYPDYHVHVALYDDRIVGTFALLVMDNLAHMGAPSAIIEDVVVDPEWQRHGVGRQMMQYAMQLCRDKGCYKMALSSSMKRDKAHMFYEALGFERHGYSYSTGIN